jgi:hypothetical protein
LIAKELLERVFSIRKGAARFNNYFTGTLLDRGWPLWRRMVVA